MTDQLRALAVLAERRFSFQHPHGGSETAVLPVPEDLLPPSGFRGHCMHMLLVFPAWLSNINRSLVTAEEIIIIF